MNALDFAAVLWKRLTYITPVKGRNPLPLYFVAKYNQSVNRLNTLADETQAAMTVHTELEQEKQNHINGAKK